MATKITDSSEASEHIRANVAEVAAASEKIAVNSESLASRSSDLEEKLSFFDLGEEPTGNTLKTINRR
jgi:methyl-accepting chemotaxis protein